MLFVRVYISIFLYIMANLNIINIAYLFFRLAPFIIVCFFVMDSVINNSLRGLVYLAGLLFGCFFTVMISRGFEAMGGSAAPKEEEGKSGAENPLNMSQNYDCNALTLGENGPISIFPLNQTVFAYTLTYLLVLITDVDKDGTGLLLKNIPMILLFCILILADFFWNTLNKCIKNPIFPIIAAGLGAIFGVVWATILTSNKLTDFYYVSGTSTKEVCSAPTQKSFKCWKSASGLSPNNNPKRQMDGEKK